MTALQLLGQIQDIKARLNELRRALDQTGVTNPNPANTTAVGLIDGAYTNMADVEQAIFTGAATPGTP